MIGGDINAVEVVVGHLGEGPQRIVDSMDFGR
jgi:hypothetical protein